MANEAPTDPATVQTPEMQAAWDDLGKLTATPELLAAKAKELGLGDEYQKMTKTLDTMQKQAQSMMKSEEELQKQWQEISEKAKSSTIKTLIAGVIGLAAGGYGLFRLAKSKDWEGFKKGASIAGGAIGGGAVLGLISKALFGGDLEAKAKTLTEQTDLLEQSKQLISNEAMKAQKPFLEAMVAKMAAAKAAPAEAQASAQAPVQAPMQAPAASSQSVEVPPSAPSIELKPSQQSVMPAEAPAVAPAPASPTAGIMPRDPSFATQATLDKAVAAGSEITR